MLGLDPGQLEQLRADGQALGPGQSVVDLEANLVALGNEIYHAAVFGEPVDFTDRQNV